jgi:hypothetical protein
MSPQQITLPVWGQVILHLRPVGDAQGGPGTPNPGGCCPCGRPSYGMMPPRGRFGANNPVAGAKLLLVPNWPLLKALF